jgi:L-lactate dehydrogenase
MTNILKKVVVIGCGKVGEAFLLSSLYNQIADEYLLIDDFSPNLAEGVMLDLQDGVSIIYNDHKSQPKIKVGSYQDCNDAELIIITVGKAQRDQQQSRSQLFKDNKEIIETIAEKLKKTTFNKMVIIVTNPVEAMTTIFQKKSNYDT